MLTFTVYYENWIIDMFYSSITALFQFSHDPKTLWKVYLIVLPGSHNIQYIFSEFGYAYINKQLISTLQEHNNREYLRVVVDHKL